MAITTPDAVPGEIIEAAWGDAVRADLTALDNTRVKKAGDTMTGALTVNAACNVNGPLTMTTATEGVGAVLIGSNTVRTTVGTTGQPSTNIVFQRHGTTDVAGGNYARFQRGGTNILVGSINLVDGSSIVYNTTSDYRLKDELGPVSDPLARLGQLRPIRYVWINDPGAGERDGFLAHEVAVVVPDAVTGEKDAVDGDGNIDPQGLDTGRLVPLLVAAVQELTARVAALEAGA